MAKDKSSKEDKVEEKGVKVNAIGEKYVNEALTPKKQE